MLSVVSVYNDVVKDTANADQNGHLGYEQFTRISRRAELNLISWLTGSVDNQRVPIPYLSQKNKDWIAPFIKKKSGQVTGGVFQRPDDYYQYENFYRLGARIASDCEEDEDVNPDEGNTPIELLDGQQFYERSRTRIESLKPSLLKPIAKEVGRTFEVLPLDLGSVTLEYIRYPLFGSIVGTIDPVYNEEIPGTVVDYEWDENAREMLVWFIVDTFSNNTREQALKQFNSASKPNP